MTLPAPPIEQLPENPHERWRFLRDVLVFQLKLVLGNLHNFVFVPVSLIAAVADLFFRSERQGARFYKVMEWARHGDEAIGLYSALDENRAESVYSVDNIVSRVEQVIVREYEKGGSAAAVKAAVDRALNKIQRETPAKFDPEEIVRRAADKIRERTNRTGPSA